MALKILVVEDSDMARNMISTVLSDGGHQVVAASQGLGETLEAYRVLHPDLVTLDLSLGQAIDGMEVLKALLEIDPRAKVVVVSANLQSRTEDLMLAAGAKAFITKPFKDGEFLDLIEKVATA